MTEKKSKRKEVMRNKMESRAIVTQVLKEPPKGREIGNPGDAANKVTPTNKKSTKHRSFLTMDKWTKRGAIVGGIWGLTSLVLWILASGGPTSSANPPIIFVILTLPASIPILIAYYIIELPGILIVFSIPLFGILIGALVGYLFSLFKKSYFVN